MLKSPILTPTKQITASDSLDYMNYLRFVLNAMGPEEILPLFNPQIINIADYNLSDQAFPAVRLICVTSIA